MNSASWRMCLSVLASCAVSFALRADPFRNLGFDEANTNTATLFTQPFGQGLTGYGPIGDLLPGWRLYQGTNPVTTVGYNAVSFVWVDGYVTLFSKGEYPQAMFEVDGIYGLQIVGKLLNQPEFSLAQSGLIPADAKVLYYRYRFSTLLVELNGQPLQTINGYGNGLSVPYSVEPTVAGFDVSQFAGQTAEIKFTTQGGLSAPVTCLDTVWFAVPEPWAEALFTTAALPALLVRWWFRNGRSPK